ncbi:MAG TPA: RNA polymerase sigma factor [Phycisphaerae bacterium]|nr:RNA polymerase sigma factor [Phycisphaerae bacterium]
MTDRGGDSEDIEQQLVAAAPRVYGFLIRLVGRPDVAEDLMQETMLRAFRSLETYLPEGKFHAWVFRIATNLARDWIRSRKRRPVTGLEGDSDALPATLRGDARPEAGLVRSERVVAVEAMIAQLSDADREVLLMRYYGELPFKEIARATGEPLGTVLARAHRALAKLGDLVSEEEP